MFSLHANILQMNKLIIELEIGARPSTTELEVVEVLIAHGVAKESIKFLKPNRTKGAKTPDILMDGAPWEIKSPKSNGSRTMEHAVRSASSQAGNIIIDLRQSQLNTNRAISQIKFHSLKRTTIKRLIVVTKGETLLDIK